MSAVTQPDHASHFQTTLTPIPSGDAPTISFPHPRHPLIGRTDDAAKVCDRLLQADVPILTLTSPGGVGKARLALEAANKLEQSFPAGIAFVDLAPVTDANHVLLAVARGLGLRSSGDQPISDVLVRYLKDQSVLLVIDNVEHLPSAAPAISALLVSCPRVKILATSRTRLQVSGEHEFAVSTLTLPNPHRLPDLADLAKIESVALLSSVQWPCDPTSGWTAKMREPSPKSAIASTVCR